MVNVGKWSIGKDFWNICFFSDLFISISHAWHDPWRGVTYGQCTCFEIRWFLYLFCFWGYTCMTYDIWTSENYMLGHAYIYISHFQIIGIIGVLSWHAGGACRTGGAESPNCGSCSGSSTPFIRLIGSTHPTNLFPILVPIKEKVGLIRSNSMHAYMWFLMVCAIFRLGRPLAMMRCLMRSGQWLPFLCYGCN